MDSSYTMFTPDFKQIAMPKIIYLGLDFIRKIETTENKMYPNMYQVLKYEVAEGKDIFTLKYIDDGYVTHTCNLGSMLVILPCGIATIVDEQVGMKMLHDRLLLLSKVKEESLKAQAYWTRATQILRTKLERKEQMDEKSRTRCTGMDKFNTSKSKSKPKARSQKSK